MIQVLTLFDIDGVVRDVGQSYRRALADTVEMFTDRAYRPTMADIDALKGEGHWNNDWLAAQELVNRYYEAQGRSRSAGIVDQVDPADAHTGTASSTQTYRATYTELVAFFQQRYRGPNPEDPDTWTGYISQEPLLVDRAYFDNLTAAGIPWGFVSGATRPSANYVLDRRLGLVDPPLVAMGDAPDKPDPTGLIGLADRLDPTGSWPVVYAGDTVADILTIVQARDRVADRRWYAVGILPPHVQPPEATDPAIAQAYADRLRAAGADQVLDRLTDLTADRLAAGLIPGLA